MTRKVVKSICFTLLVTMEIQENNRGVAQVSVGKVWELSVNYKLSKVKMFYPNLNEISNSDPWRHLGQVKLQLNCT